MSEVCFDDLDLSNVENNYKKKSFNDVNLNPKDYEDYVSEEEEEEEDENYDIITMDVDDENSELQGAKLKAFEQRLNVIINGLTKNQKVTKPEQVLDYDLFQYLKLKIRHYIYDIKVEPEANPNMTDEELVDVVEYLNAKKSFARFQTNLSIIQERIVDKFTRDVMSRTGNDPSHPMNDVVKIVTSHKEIHTRRIKASPNKIRNKFDVGEAPEDVFNVINLEKCSFGGSPSDLKWMIVNPLPSDYDPTALDPQDGGLDHKIALVADELQNNVDETNNIPKTFGFVVTPEWELMLTFIHSIVYFDDYVNEIIPKKIDTYSNKLNPQKDSWATTWKKLVSNEYKNKQITQFSSNNSKPQMVSIICKLRDSVRTIIQFDAFLNE